MAESFPNLVEATNLQIQIAKQTPNMIKTKYPCQYIIVKVRNARDKENYEIIQ